MERAAPAGWVNAASWASAAARRFATGPAGARPLKLGQKLADYFAYLVVFDEEAIVAMPGMYGLEWPGAGQGCG
ncbi:hypothetical protein SAMN05421878_11355 [Actinobaculum suis]|uniref:Uncharacterized protein n=1 Tax=Actinobaculum suis TaxID=1657 RepID=A0A1G7DX09_9ACTO|nr:hypothetical protein SAMN05421878_11355 [Actinobaculum suis]